MELKFQSVARVVLRVVDRLTDALALSGLAAIVLVVSWQVFGRYVLQASPSWAPETALTLLAWLGFLGIAIGVREHTHIGVTFVADRLPPRARAAVLKLSPALFLLFGSYLVVQGWDFTMTSMSSIMPATGLPNAVRFAAMPVTGALVSVYSLLHLLNVETSRASRTGPQTTETGSEAGDDD